MKLDIKKIVSTILLGMVALTFQSCLVTKKYSRPDTIKTTPDYRGDNLPVSQANMAKQSWQVFFQDTILKSHISEALANNKNYLISLEQVKIANASLKQSKAALYPSLNASAQWKESIEGNQLGYYDLSGILSWEADIWGKLTSGKRAAQAKLLATEENKSAVKTMLVSQVASSYIFLLSLDEQLRIAKESLKIRKEHIRTMKALKTAGMVNEVNLQQSISQYYAVESLQKNIEHQVFTQENTFCTLLGREMGKVKRISLEAFAISTELGVGVPADLIAHRPDVKAAEFALRESFELTNIARAQFYPSLTITASGGYNAMKLENWIKPSSLFFNTLSSLSQPIFNKRRIRTQHEISKMNQRQSLLSFEDKLLTASKEVSDALHLIRNNEQQYEIKIKKLEADKKAVELSKTLLKQGLINYLDVLISQDNALATNLDMINLTQQKWISRVQLYRTLGGGVL